MIRIFVIGVLLGLLAHAYTALYQCHAPTPKPTSFQPLQKTT